jgi:hypothetical protein
LEFKSERVFLHGERCTLAAKIATSPGHWPVDILPGTAFFLVLAAREAYFLNKLTTEQELSGTGMGT